MECFANNLRSRHDQKMAEAAVRRGVGRLKHLVPTYALVAGGDALTVKLDLVGRSAVLVDIGGAEVGGPALSPLEIERSVRAKLVAEGLDP
jgi:hypothetical protein